MRRADGYPSSYPESWAVYTPGWGCAYSYPTYYYDPYLYGLHYRAYYAPIWYRRGPYWRRRGGNCSDQSRVLLRTSPKLQALLTSCRDSAPRRIFRHAQWTARRSPLNQLA